MRNKKLISAMNNPDIPDEIKESLSYRIPLQVTAVKLFLVNSSDAYPICPKCTQTMDREYQAFCDRCGQKLNWKGFSKAKVIDCRGQYEITTPPFLRPIKRELSYYKTLGADHYK